MRTKCVQHDWAEIGAAAEKIVCWERRMWPIGLKNDITVCASISLNSSLSLLKTKLVGLPRGAREREREREREVNESALIELSGRDRKLK